MFGMPQHWPSKQPPKTRGFSLLVFVSCSYSKEFCLTQNVAGHNYELSPVVFFEATPFAPGNQPFHEWWVSVETETSKLPNIYWDVEICSSFLRM